MRPRIYYSEKQKSLMWELPLWPNVITLFQHRDNFGKVLTYSTWRAITNCYVYG